MLSMTLLLFKSLMGCKRNFLIERRGSFLAFVCEKKYIPLHSLNWCNPYLHHLTNRLFVKKRNGKNS